MIHARSLLLALVASACASEPTHEKPVYQPPRPAPPVTAEAESAEPAPVDPTAPVPPAPAPSSASGTTLSVIDGKQVPIEELLELWIHRESREVYTYLQTIVERRVVEGEAQRLGVRVPPEQVDRAVEELRARMRAKIEELDRDVTFDDYVRGRLFLDPGRYKAVQREGQVHSLTLERVVRAWLLGQERADIRLIILLAEDPADEVQAALDAGRPFEEVAREFSRDPSRDDGGRMPSVVRTEDLLLSRLAFSTSKGGVIGPVENADQVLWVKVVDFPEVVAGTWAVIAPAVEASLAELPITDIEFVQWREAVYPFHEIDNRPFLELFGEPLEGP